ncbi:hypothetical protein [Sorangium sp. So ce542]|uniref:hypothetical protein n=1 Tax=Sorangium sp. So ce542 TaxID=3133316 RepID=UPI003F5F19F9
MPTGLLTHFEPLASADDTQDKVEAYTGVRRAQNYGITVGGSGAWARGHISGVIKCYDYRALYNVYQLNQNKAMKFWIFRYRKDVTQSELKKTFETSQEGNINYDLDFIIQGNNYSIGSVFVTYETIRLRYRGQTKDFVVINKQSAGATTPDGSPYPGGFQAV